MHPYIDKLYIYDISSCDRYFCDQGCTAGMGCKKDYSPDNHSIRIHYDMVINQRKYNKRIKEQEKKRKIRIMKELEAQSSKELSDKRKR